jgi:hypothetical protein
MGMSSPETTIPLLSQKPKIVSRNIKLETSTIFLSLQHRLKIMSNYLSFLSILSMVTFLIEAFQISDKGKPIEK